jgi:thiamine biosynthesis lipoprotein
MISAANLSAVAARGQHVLLAFLLVLLGACEQAPAPISLQGDTMGTRYHVTLASAPKVLTTSQLQSGIEEVLEAIETSMSTWRDESEISRFNRTPAGEWFTVSPDFLEVFSLARTVAQASGGAYDVSVEPLVELWGFGPGAGDSIPGDSIPALAQIDAAMLQVGESYVDVDMASSRLRKRRSLALDFSSIAKGYGVDKVALWLQQKGHKNYMVEIGGEIRTLGHSPRGSPWRIAIERPEPSAREAAAILEVSERAVATSGDYRNFFKVDGVRYSHSIDPRSGHPVRHQLVSVTVVHENAALADAWATALTVLGPEQALQTALRENLAVYLISRGDNGLSVDKTPAIAAYLQ